VLDSYSTCLFCSLIKGIPASLALMTLAPFSASVFGLFALIWRYNPNCTIFFFWSYF
jgi:hypothetical protein